MKNGKTTMKNLNNITLDKNEKILIVGLGVIGGSYADALSAGGYAVGAIDTNISAIEYAKSRRWIFDGRSVPDGAFIGEFQLIVFALYPAAMLEWIEKYQKFIAKNALLTDVCGVKRATVYAAQNMLRPDLEFIGAHPMRGKEEQGVKFADRHIFGGGNYIVTPTGKNTENAIEKCAALGNAIGARRVSILSPEKHDAMIGFVSQLTHCIAVALMACKDPAELADYTGDSFRDLTRIAKINDRLWSELFFENKDELLSQMKLFSDQFSAIAKCIETNDENGLKTAMRLSTARRALFDKTEQDEDKEKQKR